MKIACISDTHGQHRSVTIPEVDVLIHAGDIAESMTHLQDFLSWTYDVPAQRVVVIPGNHDRMIEARADIREQLFNHPRIDFLMDSGVTIGGLNLYGSPWQPEFFNWAFNLPRGQALAEKWALIPQDTDILITHGPPMGIRDFNPKGMQCGCADLGYRIGELDHLALHVFGHIHYSYGCAFVRDTMYVNASVCNERYQPVNQPIVIDTDELMFRKSCPNPGKQSET